MNENDAFYNALIDVAAWDKENTLDRFMNSDSLFKKFLYNLLLQTVRMMNYGAL